MGATYHGHHDLPSIYDPEFSTSILMYIQGGYGYDRN